MSTFAYIQAKFVYETKSDRDESMEKIEELGYTEDSIVSDTEEIDGERQPIIKIGKREYRNLGRYLDRFSEQADRYAILVCIEAFNSVQVSTEDDYWSWEIPEWVETQDDLPPQPKNMEDPPDHLTQIVWGDMFLNTFFHPDHYEEYTDLSLY